MTTPHRVVITGLGAITPLGHSPSSFWEGLIAGRSAAAPTTNFDVSQLSTKFGCQINDFDAKQYMDAKQARRLDPFTRFALAAAKDAFDDAGIDTATLTEEQRQRFGVIYGSGIGGLDLIERQAKIFHDRGPGRVSPFLIPMMITNIAAGLIAVEHGLNGPNHCVVSACATSNHNIGDALLLLRHGYADAILAGGAEKITAMGVAGFAAMKALSQRNDDPATASRPFDATRDGFVPGEGAGALTLETLEHAQARGAKIYCELAGIGMSADAYHFAAPDPNGTGAILAMRNALQDAGINADEVDYTNVHGTATPLGDIAETNAIKKVFGDHAYKMSLSSTKSMIGHLLGAAGAAEAIASIMAINHGLVPPTINLHEPDPECDLDYTPNVAKERDVRVAISNAFGFGGHNTTIVLRRFT